MELVFKFYAQGNDGQVVNGSLLRNSSSGDLIMKVQTSNGRYVSRPITFVVNSIDDCINTLLACGYSTISIKSK